ncbi:hypothetical protein DP107_05750 [Haloglomus irregulare]|jgi:hypothetical protein|uniref:Transcriptional regulator n=1 Tax=Haloglomus irregulare TaxID=2234134 RepID=A0A554ND87_9EURY|nr:DUF5821 family protein [Haloglomus irregulare]TSD15346.1 hypothetical protein DP107_05750 [Haloglomus irregulare]
MDANLLEDSITAVLSEALTGVDETVFVVNPAPGTVDELVEVLSTDDDATVRLLADEAVLKDVMDDFIVASRAADLVEADQLEFRTYANGDNTLLVTEDSVAALVAAGGQVAALTTTDESFIEGTHAAYSDAWDAAETYDLRTPAISRVRETLRESLGPDSADDFDAMLATLGTARGDGDGLDEVTISLLVAAKNRELLYDISKWGEDIGIASKATFSRTKTRLEEAGLIDTEKVPIDVGRPRLRLLLDKEGLEDASEQELISAANSALTA